MSRIDEPIGYEFEFAFEWSLSARVAAIAVGWLDD